MSVTGVKDAEEIGEISMKDENLSATAESTGAMIENMDAMNSTIEAINDNMDALNENMDAMNENADAMNENVDGMHDPMDVMNENTPLEKYKISARALRMKTKSFLSAMLNPVMVLPTDEGLTRDWQGLAELVFIPGERISQLQCDSDPTLKVLNLWAERNSEDYTLEKLLSCFEKLDRYDIIDDIKDLLEEDILEFQKSSGGASKLSEWDVEILTRDDYDSIEQGQGPQNYDAFVLFAEEDMDFATKLIDTMEKEFDLKFCTKHRDLVGGVFETDVIVKLTQERCNRFVVIFSTHFFRSAYNEYFTNFAQIVGIEQSRRKLIPVVYEPCDIPLKWKCYLTLDYDKFKKRSETRQFWEKLRDAVRTPKPKVEPPQPVRLPVQQPTRPFRVTRVLKEEDNSLRIKKDEVKFNSMIDINTGESVAINNSPSSNSLSTMDSEPKKAKKPNWLKKFLHNADGKIKQAGSGEAKEKKKRFFVKRSKRKAQAVALAN